MIATATLFAAQAYNLAHRDEAEPLGWVEIGVTMGFDLWMATIVFG